MARLVNRPVRVIAFRGGAPSALAVAGGRGGAERVVPVRAVLDHWRETGRWWAGEGERSVYRLLMAGGGVWEVDRDEATGRWSLYKIYD